MTKLIRFTLTSVVIFLLTISLVAAHGADESEDDTNHQDQPMMGANQIRDVSDHMNIKGTIKVEDSIILTLNVSPTGEMEDMMDDHMDTGGHIDDQSMSMNDYMNEITVELYSLVEFEDTTGNGYSSDDFQVSNYTLNNESLNQPEIVNDRYLIRSFDNLTFLMDVDLKFEDNLFHGFKWSLEVNYQFQSNSTKLAMLHRISTSAGSMMELHQMQHGNMHEGSHMQYDENHMDDNDEHLPMSFDWVTTVLVDNQDKTVVATSENSVFALAVPQGESIIYDPEISEDVDDIRSIDGQLSGLIDSFQEFVDTMNSPTLLGIALGFTSIVLFAVIATYSRRK